MTGRCAGRPATLNAGRASRLANRRSAPSVAGPVPDAVRSRTARCGSGTATSTTSSCGNHPATAHRLRQLGALVLPAPPRHPRPGLAADAPGRPAVDRRLPRRHHPNHGATPPAPTAKRDSPTDRAESGSCRRAASEVNVSDERRSARPRRARPRRAIEVGGEVRAQERCVAADAVEEARRAGAGERQAEDVQARARHDPAVMDDLALAVQHRRDRATGRSDGTRWPRRPSRAARCRAWSAVWVRAWEVGGRGRAQGPRGRGRRASSSI